MSNYVAYQLKQNDLFADVPVSDLEVLANAMHRESYEAGAVVFRQGDMGDGMYIIVKGKIRIYSEENPELTYMHYQAPQIFGEFSMIDNKPRSASAAAAEPLEAMVLKRADLMAVLEKRPEVGMAMMKTLSQRARYTTEYLEQVMTWTRRLSEGEYELVQLNLQTFSGHDPQVRSLVSNFLTLINTVQEREAKLKTELARLRSELERLG